MPLVTVPGAVHSQLHEAAAAAGVELRWASGAVVRAWLREHGGWEEGLTREEAVAVLRHVATGVEGEDVGELCGLRLLPLLDGGWAALSGAGQAGPLLLCASAERGFLGPHARLVVDVEVESALGQLLRGVAG